MNKLNAKWVNKYIKLQDDYKSNTGFTHAYIQYHICQETKWSRKDQIYIKNICRERASIRNGWHSDSICRKEREGNHSNSLCKIDHSLPLLHFLAHTYQFGLIFLAIWMASSKPVSCGGQIASLARVFSMPAGPCKCNASKFDTHTG